MPLTPINLDRVADDLNQLLMALDALGGINEIYSDTDVPEVLAPAIPPDATPELKEYLTLYETVGDFHRAIFDTAWNDYRVATQRLNIVLNEGDIDLLDCDWETRRHLNLLWDWLEKCQCSRPEFVDGGPQELAGPAIMWGWVGRDLLQSLKGRQAGEVIVTPIEERYRPPKCKKCGSQMRVVSTKQRTRHLKCTTCTHTCKVSRTSTGP